MSEARAFTTDPQTMERVVEIMEHDGLAASLRRYAQQLTNVDWPGGSVGVATLDEAADWMDRLAQRRKEAAVSADAPRRETPPTVTDEDVEKALQMFNGHLDVIAQRVPNMPARDAEARALRKVLTAFLASWAVPPAGAPTPDTETVERVRRAANDFLANYGMRDAEWTANEGARHVTALLGALTAALTRATPPSEPEARDMDAAKDLVALLTPDQQEELREWIRARRTSAGLPSKDAVNDSSRWSSGKVEG